jgi:hypothetical protein
MQGYHMALRILSILDRMWIRILRVNRIRMRIWKDTKAY